MRASTMVLKQGEVFVVSDPGGDITQRVQGAGVYFRDTRYLSDFRLTLNGEILDLLDFSAEHNMVGIAQFANPWLEMPDGNTLLPHTIGARRYREIDDALGEQIEIWNYNEFAVSLEIQLTFAADFRDIFDVRGFRRMKRGRVLLPQRSGNELTLGYRAPDDAINETVIRFNRPPDETTIEAGAGYTMDIEELRTMLPGNDRIVRSLPAGRPPRAAALFRVTLEPQSSSRIELRLSPRTRLTETDEPAVPLPSVFASADWSSPEQFTSVTTNHEIFNKVLDRSLRDIRTLVTPFPGGRLLAAGIPWYVAPFGRDSLIAALQTLMFSQDLAAETLRFLARYQGTKEDPWTEEEPGKILHEQRFGEMARLGEVPHAPYYGTVDATPLFVVLLCRLMSWQDNPDLFDEFLPAVERALVWIDQYADNNQDGFIDYGRPSRRGLDNQGWKDSDNSLQFPDHSPVEIPIAVIEAQGYVYQAKRELADLLGRHGLPERAAELRAQAETLRQRFEERFWSEADQFYGQAIEGNGRLVNAISSNPGHCLYSGIASPERAEAVVRRLREPDMYSGWGIRTLSATMPHYNPMSYHNGSVWPHDNSIIVAGFRRYGYHEDATAVATDLLQAASQFDYGRLPELFCGFSREFERYTVPISYPVSCSPQTWAAGTIPLLLQTLLGLEPDAANRRLHLQPHLPEWLDEIRIRNLRFAGRMMNLDVRGHGPDFDVSHNADSDVEIVVGEPVQRA